MTQRYPVAAKDQYVTQSALDLRVTSEIAGMAPMVWLHHGTDAPTLAGFPGARVGDVIRRMSDGQEWRVDE